MRLYSILSALFLLATGACGGSGSSQARAVADSASTSYTERGSFAEDLAYEYVRQQVEFGPRVPGTEAHRKCGDWLVDMLRTYGADTVIVSGTPVKAWDGTVLPVRNIFARYNSDAKDRILLVAHYDTRPWADQDPDPDKRMTPIDGANDGASGVGVLLEIARQIQKEAPTVGIDIIFFDAEDYGTPAWHRGIYKPHDWCLGSQYWGRTPHVQGYYARYGILLDMVGGKGGTFYYEPYSYRTARKEVKKIWEKAHELGYGSYFVKQEGSEVTDDHVYVNQLARIPCVDIINYDPVYENSSFGPTWHTVNDNISNIDRNTLKAVGQTVMDVIYNEK